MDFMSLYLAEIFTVSSDSSVFSSFDDFNPVHTVLAAQTRSHTLSLQRPKAVVLQFQLNILHIFCLLLQIYLLFPLCLNLLCLSLQG
jgi:hypothetical protein